MKQRMMVLPEGDQGPATGLNRSRRSLIAIPTAVRDRGAASIEQIGIVTVVALLVTASTLGLATYGPQLSSKLCELASGMGLAAGSCTDPESEPVASDSPTDEDFLPTVCTLRETTSKSNSEIKLGFFTIGQNNGFVVSENADGTVTATVAEGSSLGAEAGAGAKYGNDGVALGVDVDFGGGVKFESGSTWSFDNWSEWETAESELKAYVGQQADMKNAGLGAPGLHLWYWLSDGYLDPPKEPNITTRTTELKFYADAQSGLRVEKGVDSDGSSEWFDPNRGIYGEGELIGGVTQTENSETGETTETFTFNAEGDAGVDWGMVSGGPSGEYEQAYQITRDGNDEVTSIEFMRESGGTWSGEIDVDPEVIGAGGDNTGSVTIGADKENQRTVETTTLDVNAGNRDIVNDWITENQNALVGNQFIYPANAFSPTENVTGDPLAELLYREGKGSLRIYDNVASGFSFAAEFALGLKLGASFEYEESETTLNSAYFVGAPRANGERPHIEDATCVK